MLVLFIIFVLLLIGAALAIATLYSKQTASMVLMIVAIAVLIYVGWRVVQLEDEVFALNGKLKNLVSECLAVGSS